MALIIAGKSVGGFSKGKYCTGDEIIFLKGLGTYCVDNDACTRAELLDGYIRAAEMRTDWCHMDKIAVLDFARSELAKERGK